MIKPPNDPNSTSLYNSYKHCKEANIEMDTLMANMKIEMDKWRAKHIRGGSRDTDVTDHLIRKFCRDVLDRELSSKMYTRLFDEPKQP